MTLRCGLLVVERFEVGKLDPVSSGVMNRTPVIPSNASEVLASYRGFEGVPWPHAPSTIPLFERLAPLEQLGSVRRYVADLSGSIRCELMYCCRMSSEASCGSVPAGFVQLGFDVGIYEGEDNSFSAVFHELLFGKHDELARFADRLNDVLLFQSFTDAREFLDRRTKLLAEGFDLESDEGMEFGVILIATPFITGVSS